MKVIEEKIEGDYRYILYDNGTIVKELISEGIPEEKPIIIPPSPLEVLKKENEELKQKVYEQGEAIADLTLLVSTQIKEE